MSQRPARSGGLSTLRLTAIRPTGPALVALLALVAVASAVVADRLAFDGTMSLWQLDMPKIDYPLASFFHAALETGRLPLWNGRLGLGYPLYAEGQIGAFYLPNWLLYQLTPLTALDAVRVLHLTAAGLGTALLALRLSGSRTGAVLASIVAVLGGAIVTKLEWTNVVEAYGLLPWVLLPLVRRPAPTRRGLVVAGVLWGLQALAGHPNVWLLTGLAAVLIVISIRPDRHGLATAAVFGLLGVGVGAVQLVPTLVLTSLSARSAGVSPNDLFASAATVFDPLSLGFANAFVTPGDTAWDIHSVWYPDTLFPLLEADAYVTLTVVALAAVGSRTRRARPLLVVAGVMIAIPVVAALRPAVWADVPLLNGLRSPVRSYLVLALMLAILAAIGVGRLGRSRRGLRLAAALVVGLIAGYLVCLAVAVALPAQFEAVMTAFSIDMPPDIAAQRRDLAVAALSRPFPFALEASVGLGSVAIAAVLARRGSPDASRDARVAGRLALLAAAAVPLALLSPQANPTAPLSAFDSGSTPFVRAVAAVRAHRLLTVGEPGFYEGMPDQLAMAGVPDLRMFSSLDLLASDRLLAMAQDDPDRDLLRQAIGVDTLVTFDAPCPGETLASIAQPPSTVCRIDALRPPYWLPAAAARAVDGSSGSPIGPVDAEVDLARAVADAREAQVESSDDAGGRFVVDAPADGWVWIDRAWWPAWQTTVDGRGVTPLRALAGQLIPVTAGRHVIGQTLVPWEAILGAVVSVVTLLAGAVWIRMGRPTAGPPGSGSTSG